MNVFYLDHNPARCAEYHCDKHVLKMIIETAQLLSTAVHSIGGDVTGLYRPTHENHPCAIWARSGRAQFQYLVDLLKSLGEEYEYRWGKQHKTIREVYPLLKNKASLFDSQWNEFVLPPQCMPEEYRSMDTCAAYRKYYHSKLPIISYTRRTKPGWLVDLIKSSEVTT